MNILKLNTVPLDDKVIIKKGGVYSGDARLQSKSVAITKSGTTKILPDFGYDGLKEVKVSAAFQDKTIDLTTKDTKIITPDMGFSALEKVEVTPTVQEKEVLVMPNGPTSIEVEDGYVGLSKVKIKHRNTSDYLTIEALEDGLEVQFSYNDLEYCIDGNGEWFSLPQNTSTPTINTGQTLSFKAVDPYIYVNENSSKKGMGTFTINRKCNVWGNIMSLTNGDDARFATTIKGTSFYRLFNNCSTIVSCANLLLPKVTSYRCYMQMFFGCTSLVEAPKLPAMVVEKFSYNAMFNGCTSLVNAPELPATSVDGGGYESMFSHCTSIVNAPALPATTLGEDAMGARRDGAYTSMFYGCTSLINAPELPATDLGDYCYIDMFNGCTSLVNAPELPATKLTSDCYKRMFANCTSLVNAPELPAINLINDCYYGMFEGCTNLNYIKMLATDISASKCLTNWVSGVSSIGTFVKNSKATWDVVGVNGVPDGWTVEYADA